MLKKERLAMIHEENVQTHCLKNKGDSMTEEPNKVCYKWFTQVKGIYYKEILRYSYLLLNIVPYGYLWQLLINTILNWNKWI